jgi:protein MpaA
MRTICAAVAVVTFLAAGAAAGESPGPVRHPFVLGHSVLGTPITGVQLGDPDSKRRVAVICCIHGNENAGLAVVQQLEDLPDPAGFDLFLVEDANPDGVAAGTRDNAHGVDLNRNFPWRWHRHGKPGWAHYSGPKPLSEPESRALAAFLLRVKPQVVIWYHQALGLVDESGGSLAVERQFATLTGYRLLRLKRYDGSATSWANAELPGSTSFVVELPPGELTSKAALRQARAVLALARGVG